MIALKFANKVLHTPQLKATSSVAHIVAQRVSLFAYLGRELAFTQALDSALETALQLALSVPLADVTAFPKFCKAYFVFFEILFRNHIAVVVALDTPVFMRVMHALHEGLQVCRKEAWGCGCTLLMPEGGRREADEEGGGFMNCHTSIVFKTALANSYQLLLENI